MNNSINKATVLVSGLFGLPDFLTKSLNSGISYTF
jgi:hypothetical protein